MTERELHAISSQLGRILKALEKIGDELERYNEKHKWDVQPYIQPYVAPSSGYTCAKCGQWVGYNQSHFCWGTTTIKMSPSSNNSTFTTPPPEI